MKVDKSVFREYDIRGIWNKTIDKEFAFGLGVAFGKFLKEKLNIQKGRISVGYDARNSSVEILKALSKGLNCENIEVLNIGMVPTPVQYFSLFNLDVDGGVMITASHNPSEYNGFKLSVKTNTIFGSQIQEIYEIMKDINIDENCKAKELIEEVDILTKYKEFMMIQFGYLKDIEEKPKVVLDAGNGVAGFVAYDIFTSLGYETKGLYIEPDGNFPNHHPDPTVEKNLVDLKRVLAEEDYDVGIGYDGDGDRIGVVLKNGDILWGDQLLLLLAEDLAKTQKGVKVVADVKCSDAIFKKMEEIGCKPIMYKTGHSLIKAKMKEENAPLAGEMSGHIFMGDRYFGYDDAIYVSLRLVEIITREKLDLIKWKNSLPKVYNTPEIRIDCPEDKKQKVIEKTKAYLEENKDQLNIVRIDTIDGIRFKTEYGFGLLRASNTQPVLVLRFEADTEDNLNRIKDTILKQVEKFINE